MISPNVMTLQTMTLQMSLNMESKFLAEEIRKLAAGPVLRSLDTF